MRNKLWVGHLQTPANITATDVIGKSSFRVMISVALAIMHCLLVM